MDFDEILVLSQVCSERCCFYILTFFTMAEARTLRLVEQEMRVNVENYPWRDSETRITGSVEAWRRSFPYALSANLSSRPDFYHFSLLEGIATLDMSYCTHHCITSYSFSKLSGSLKQLRMTGCRQITDDALAHLKGIQHLDISYCSDGALTPAGLLALIAVPVVRVAGCNKELRDAAYAIATEQLLLV